MDGCVCVFLAVCVEVASMLSLIVSPCSCVFVSPPRRSQAAEKFAPSNSWYIRTMTTVFELGGDLVKPEVANNLMRLIAEGGGEDEEADQELRSEAVEAYLALLDKPALSNILQQVTGPGCACVRL